jgi:uncharacterized protein
MQLTRETATNVINAWEPGRIRIAERWLAGHVIVSPERLIEGWDPPAPDDLSIDHLGEALALKPDIIVLGTGTDAALPNVALMSELAALGIGFESMTTGAACRTYNVLVHEERRVVALLMNPPSASR